jgi:secondary thiamine-phosphate synthase enzyme
MFKTIHFKTSSRQCWVNLLEEVKRVVAESGIAEGLCTVYNPHTTAGLVVNSYLDANTPKDILHEIDRLVPTRLDFFHTFDTPSDAAGHVKSSLVNVSLDIPVHEGKLMTGHSQGILFVEFDGPRSRQVYVTLMGSQDAGG